LAYELDKRAAILSPRGKVLENGIAPRFFRRLAEGIFDIEDLIFRTNELADFVIGASKTYSFDLQRVIAVGYSNGANIAASMLLLRPEILSSAILFHAMVPLVPQTLPDLTNMHIFMSSGLYVQ
jgi:predicted esterase